MQWWRTGGGSGGGDADGDGAVHGGMNLYEIDAFISWTKTASPRVQNKCASERAMRAVQSKRMS